VQLVSIDPGLRIMGVAYWEDSRLEAAALLSGAEDTNIRDLEASREMASSFDQWLLGVTDADTMQDLYAYDGEIAYEKMKHYSGNAKKSVRVDDLFQLVGVSHACLSPYRQADIEPHLPGTWTSGRPKSARHAHSRNRLDEEESDTLVHTERKLKDSDVEHVLDAVGIGLYHLKRL
jgi:hypothetical protein